MTASWWFLFNINSHSLVIRGTHGAPPWSIRSDEKNNLSIMQINSKIEGDNSLFGSTITTLLMVTNIYYWRTIFKLRSAKRAGNFLDFQLKVYDWHFIYVHKCIIVKLVAIAVQMSCLVVFTKWKVYWNIIVLIVNSEHHHRWQTYIVYIVIYSNGGRLSALSPFPPIERRWG